MTIIIFPESDLRHELLILRSGSVFMMRASVSRKMWGLFAVVEPPLQLFQVAVHMLRAHLVERAPTMERLKRLQTPSMRVSACTSPTAHSSAE